MRRHRTVLCAFLPLSLTLSCAPLESEATRSSPPQAVISLPEGTTVATKGESAGVITAAFDPNATEPQLLQASADSNISDVVLAFPPGSLSIATDISLKEGATIGSELLLQDLGLATLPSVTNSAASVEITSSAAIDLKEPMILALPLPVGFGLAVDPTQRQKLGVLYRIQIQDTGEKLVGFVPATELTIDDNGKVLYPSRYFGSFQVVVFDQVVAKVEKKDTQPTFEGIQYILAGLALPSCGRADVGRVIYVEESKQFQHCGANGWVVVDLKGPPGATGPAGPAGPAGPSGSGSTGGKALAVYDSTGAKIGRFIGDNGVRAYIVTLTDGTTVTISSQGVVSQVNFSDCHYTTTDCTGTCYIPIAPGSVVGDYIGLTGKDIGGASIHYQNKKITSLNLGGSYTLSSSWDDIMNYCYAQSPQTMVGYAMATNYTPVLTVVPPMEIRTE